MRKIKYGDCVQHKEFSHLKGRVIDFNENDVKISDIHNISHWISKDSIKVIKGETK